MGFWNPGQEWESELMRIRKRLTEATECSGESADPESAVKPTSMALCVSPAVLSLCPEAEKSCSVYPG